MDNSKRYKSGIELIMYFLKGCKRYFVLAVLFVFILVFFELINPKIIGYTVDFIVNNESTIPKMVLDFIYSFGSREYILSHLWIMALVVVAIGLAGALSRYAFKMFVTMGAENLVRRMQNTLYEHIIRLPFSWHDQNKTGDIIQRCTSDVDMIKNFISEQLIELVRMIVMASFALFCMARIHMGLTVAAFIFVPVVMLYSYMFHEKIANHFEKVDTEEGRLSAIAQENLTGVRVVRAFGRENYEKNRFETKNEYYTGLWVDLMRLLSSFWCINDVMRNTEVIIILALGAYFTVNDQMTAGNYVAYLAYNNLLVWPIARLGRVVSEMSKTGVSVDRLLYIMNSAKEEDDQDAVNFPGQGKIEFKNVSFSYDTGDDNHIRVLNDVSMTIEKGQTIGILGGTGSGKSTLIQLLDGLYALDDGQILINGVDVSHIKKSDLHKNIGLVLQEPFLFSRTIEENIKVAVDGASFDEVEAAVEVASLTNSIEKFKDGYNTFVGERGVTLSGGQKQRTAIAQMLITNPAIMIFDDSLSAVDAQTDASIRAALKQASKDATVIIISHRVTTLMSADNIFVMDDGKLIESGSHKELIEQGGLYSRIFNMQSAAEEAV